ncbi:C2H2 finger domain transcription factor mtfA [Mycena indigotica]|uniref:C2H2 finger domain transcription factor mtfA n=1 Tax=Mycena indigotica TaxID=2126181 RepID=A0A8H6S2L2_9AGAR|nr:C2H2 finger domain transcription factor mtfA [Mycena indigotica]KAF7291292.1 C2H2 finger domain transcription factor mtfA [Mycena indigotica]
MASATSPTVVLPSIHEMFPEYLMPAPSSPLPFSTSARPSQPQPFLGSTRLPPRNHYLPGPLPSPLTRRFAFDSPMPTSPPPPPKPHNKAQPPMTTGRDGERELEDDESDGNAHLTNDDGEMPVDHEEDDDADDIDNDIEAPPSPASTGSAGASPTSTTTRKHVCQQCRKRFNRPSSLRIHVNTHTGATPFRCPYPNCGRAFNVNSNMRRHYRNHSIALSAAANAVAARPGSSCASTFSSCSSGDALTLKATLQRSTPPHSPMTSSPRDRSHPYPLSARRGSVHMDESESTRLRASPTMMAASWDPHRPRRYSESASACGYEESAVRGCER